MTAIDFPDAPTVGQVFDKWAWNGTVWVLRDGPTALATVTAPQTISLSGALVGLSATWAAIAGRTYRLTVKVTPSVSIATEGITLFLLTGAGAQVAASWSGPQSTANQKIGMSLQHVIVGLVGTVNYITHIGRTYANPASITDHAAPDNPSFFLVEDISHSSP
jgi:hypothetical protein